MLKKNFCRKNLPIFFRKIELLFFKQKGIQTFFNSNFFKKAPLPKTIKLYAKNRCADYFSLDRDLEEIFIIYGKTGRLCFAPNKSNSFCIEVGQENVSGCSVHVAPLESSKIYSSKFLMSDIFSEVTLIDEDGSVIEKLRARHPLHYKKHGLVRNKLGNGWIQLDIDFSVYDRNPRELIIQFKFLEGEFLALTGKNPGKYTFKELPCNFPAIVISKLFYWDIKEPKNKLLIVSESMTDPSQFMELSEIKKRMPNYTKFKETSFSFPQASSMVDSTLPHIASLMTGSHPSFHKIGDYHADPKNQTFSTNFEYLPDILRNKNFSSIGITSSGRLGFDYDWPSMFDEYFNTVLPFSDDGPNASFIIRKIVANKRIPSFYYIHLTRLHLPMLSSDLNQSPCVLPMSGSEKVIAQNDYIEIVKKQYEAFDLELGQILDFLESSGLSQNFDIILTGDHGIKMPPKWKNQIDENYDLYEEHIRVPLIYKLNGSKIQKTFDYPVSTHDVIYNVLNDSKAAPESFFNKSLGHYSISETIHHPEKGTLALAIRTEKFKFWGFFPDILSGVNIKIRPPARFLLFEKKNNEFDEHTDVSSENNLVIENFLKICTEHFEKSNLLYKRASATDGTK